MPSTAELATAVAAELLEPLAARIVELQRRASLDPDPWLTREQAAAFFNVSPSSFERLRREHAEALKPCLSHPVRWSSNALTVFKMTRGGPVVRRGRPRKNREKFDAKWTGCDYAHE